MDMILALQSFASPLADRLVLLLTNLGSEQAYIVLLIVTFVGINPVVGQRLAIALLASFYLNQHTKAFFNTPRPFELDPAIARSEEAIQTALGAAFPSGHAQGATTFWGLAAMYVRQTWFWIFVVILIIAMSLSRIYLGVHFPIDVIGGILIGLVIMGVAYWLFNELKVLKDTPKSLIIIVTLVVLLIFQFAFPTVDSSLLLGATGAFIIGPLLIRHYPSENYIKRTVLTPDCSYFGFWCTHCLEPFTARRNKTKCLGWVCTLLIGWFGRNCLCSLFRASYRIG